MIHVIQVTHGNKHVIAREMGWQHYNAMTEDLGFDILGQFVSTDVPQPTEFSDPRKWQRGVVELVVIVHGRLYPPSIVGAIVAPSGRQALVEDDVFEEAVS